MKDKNSSDFSGSRNQNKGLVKSHLCAQHFSQDLCFFYPMERFFRYRAFHIQLFLLATFRICCCHSRSCKPLVFSLAVPLRCQDVHVDDELGNLCISWEALLQREELPGNRSTDGPSLKKGEGGWVVVSLGGGFNLQKVPSGKLT